MRVNFGIFWLFIISLFLSSCMGTRHLRDNQLLLYKQKIKGNEEITKEELEQFYRQSPNKKIPLIPFAPYVWVYYMGLNNYDSAEFYREIEKIENKFDRKIATKQQKGKKVKRLEAKKVKKIKKKELALEEGNTLMRWGEPLSIFDEDKTSETRDQFDIYLKTKGFFNSHVDYRLKRKGRKISVTYHIQENIPHKVDTFYITTKDDSIRQVIDENIKDSFIDIGDNYDQELLIQERNRIEALLQNNGYYDFKKQFIEYRVDTLGAPYQTKIEMVINKPRRGYHKIFNIDSVIFVTDAGDREAGDRSSMTYNNIKYSFYKKRFSKKILDQRVFIYPNEKYSKLNTLNTQRQLANLNNFKFINVNYDTTGGFFIANIFASKLPKYQMTNELGVNVTVGIPGPFYRFSLVDRNVFRGLENMEFSGYFAFEGVAGVAGTDSSSVYSSTEAGLNLSLYFPQFIFPGFKKWKRNSGTLNPQTVLQTGVDFTKRPEYVRTGVNASWVYNWRNYDTKTLYNFTFLKIGLINSDLDSAFNAYLEDLQSRGNNLKTSFDPSFITSSQFLVTFNFDPIDNIDNSASFLRVFAESGGVIYNFYQPKFLEANDLESYQFVKGSIEYIRHVPVTENGVFASRVKFGSAYPYSDNRVLPYEKYFFSGGSNSVRAWYPRRLGPGSYNHNLSDDNSEDVENPYQYSNKIEQPGEILIEANLEYRSKLVGFFDWAFFVDIGNIWLINEDNTRPGGNFEFNRFYKEFGIGSGLGLRLNFSFLIVRFDYGVKIYDPIRPEGERFIGDDYSIFQFKGLPDQTRLNFAIGYPF